MWCVCICMCLSVCVYVCVSVYVGCVCVCVCVFSASIVPGTTGYSRLILTIHCYSSRRNIFSILGHRPNYFGNSLFIILERGPRNQTRELRVCSPILNLGDTCTHTNTCMCTYSYTHTTYILTHSHSNSHTYTHHIHTHHIYTHTFTL